MPIPYNDPAKNRYQSERKAHWDSVACWLEKHSGLGGAYHRRLMEVYRYLVPKGGKVIEIGCGRGDLLASLEPADGLGVDLSPEMVAQARQRHPDLRFMEADVHTLSLEEKFDTIILSDLLNELWDVQQTLEQLRPLCHSGTRLICNYYSRLWELPLNLARALGLAAPQLYQNWLTPDDINGLLKLSGFETIRTWNEVLFPFGIPLLAPFFNRFLARIWPFNNLALSNFTLARPVSSVAETSASPVVTVVVPARNEAGNIRSIMERVPEMGSGTELVFVEGNSSDDTYDAIERLVPEFPNRRIVLMRQDGKGKGDAVRKGFAAAAGEVLMILDADLTVPPEDLPRFYRALMEDKGDFINGVRLVYPMEKDAMRFFNFLGNKFFSFVFSWLLGQPVKDTLCGTKVLWKKDYDRIAANRSYFGDFDPFGDFDLIFGASHLNFKIIDLPIRYRERTYGTTNIQRWRHGWLLLQMVAFAMRRIKFT